MHWSDDLSRLERRSLADACKSQCFRNLEGILTSDSTIILTAAQVCHRLTVSEATLRRYSAGQPDFPRKIQLGPRRIGFLKSDVEEWIASRRQAATAAAKA